ncbi:MAG: DinB family protein [Balneolales bacterium]
MILTSLIQIFERDLNRLKNEIESYPHEADLWRLSGQINNSAGNLCLHLLGNLNHYIGATLGNTGYRRDREAEFDKKNIPAAELSQGIDETTAMIRRVLGSLKPDDLAENYPKKIYPNEMTVYFFLLHLFGHMNYHIGQINYHRRLI